MADPRHKRDTPARLTSRMPIVSAAIAAVVTVSAVAYGVSLGAQQADSPDIASAEPPRSAAASAPIERQRIVSRANTRMSRPTRSEKMLSTAVTRRVLRQVHAKQWTTAPLNVWTEPGEDGRKIGLLAESSRVPVTGRSLWGRDEVVVNGRSRWVTVGYLARRKPSAIVEPSGASLGGTCSNGTSVPSGVSSNIAAVHDAVCAVFPEITTYGTLRSDGEHAQGIAVDIMVSGSRGWEVAEFVRANFEELGVSYVIHARNIWSVQRAAEGWRGMEDRGSTTANHFDHVHVTTF